MTPDIEAELDELKNMIQARKKNYLKVTHLDIRGLRFSCDGDGVIVEETGDPDEYNL